MNRNKKPPAVAVWGGRNGKHLLPVSGFPLQSVDAESRKVLWKFVENGFFGTVEEFVNNLVVFVKILPFTLVNIEQKFPWLIPAMISNSL